MLSEIFKQRFHKECSAEKFMEELSRCKREHVVSIEFASVDGVVVAASLVD